MKIALIAALLIGTVCVLALVEAEQSQELSPTPPQRDAPAQQQLKPPQQAGKQAKQQQKGKKGQSQQQKKKQVKKHVKKHKKGHHLSYKQWGLDWGGLCKTGQRQSPISIITKKATKRNPQRDVTFKFEVAPKCSMVNNGHTIKVGGKKCKMGSMSITGTTYNVAQFHVHAPSEHLIDGVRYPLELHIVTQKQGATGLNDLAVMGLLFKRSRRCNPLLRSLVRYGKFPRREGQKRIVRNVDLTRMNRIETGGRFYVYPGSLTTPPCAETVTFHVMTRPEPACRRQLRALRRIFGKAGNARIVNPHNARVVETGYAVPSDAPQDDSFDDIDIPTSFQGDFLRGILDE